MAIPRAFLSFDFDHDEKWRNLFAGQCKTDSPTPFTAADWSSRTDLPQSTWEAEIKARINSTNMLIVLVGRYMGSATGVDKEISMAKDVDVPLFGVYVDAANSASTLPAGLPRNSVVPWKWDQIAHMVDQAIKMGKNA